MIEVTNANKFFNRGKRNRIHVIDHTSFTLEDSGLVAILGPSGCGKTTLLNCIGGLDRPDSGRIKINGKRINSIFSSHTDNIRNASIGYIFQNYHLMDDLSVFDNDGMEGFYVPESAFRDMMKDAGAQAMQSNISFESDGYGLSGEALALQALQNMYQSASSAISGNIRKNKARIKYNTIVYMVNADALSGN